MEPLVKAMEHHRGSDRSPLVRHTVSDITSTLKTTAIPSQVIIISEELGGSPYVGHELQKRFGEDSVISLDCIK